MTARAPDRFGHAFVKHGAHGDLVATEDRSETLLVTPADRLAFGDRVLNLRELRRCSRVRRDHDERGGALAIRRTDDVRAGDRELAAACAGEQPLDPAIRRDEDLLGRVTRTVAHRPCT